jgi:hypothetical protein
MMCADEIVFAHTEAEAEPGAISLEPIGSLDASIRV